MLHLVKKSQGINFVKPQPVFSLPGVSAHRTFTTSSPPTTAAWATGLGRGLGDRKGFFAHVTSWSYYTAHQPTEKHLKYSYGSFIVVQIWLPGDGVHGFVRSVRDMLYLSKGTQQCMNKQQLTCDGTHMQTQTQTKTGWQDGSMGEGLCHQARGPRFDPWHPHGGKNRPLRVAL